MQDCASVDVELLRGLIVVHLTTTENQTLLRRRHTRLFLYFLLYPRDLVLRIDV